jgi:hypothetical protein
MYIVQGKAYPTHKEIQSHRHKENDHQNDATVVGGWFSRKTNSKNGNLESQ